MQNPLMMSRRLWISTLACEGFGVIERDAVSRIALPAPVDTSWLRQIRILQYAELMYGRLGIIPACPPRNAPKNNMKFNTITSIGLTVALGACSTLPSSGPTGSQISRDLTRRQIPAIDIVEVNAASALPATEAGPSVGLPELPAPPTDVVGPGDVLSISIYEAGVTLFGSSNRAPDSGAFDPTVKEQVLPPTRVDDDGYIAIPYGGRVHVLGRTVAEVQQLVRQSLRRFSQNPQVIVTFREAITNSVIVSGEVSRPGRLVLQTNHESLSDVVALAGGYRGNSKDLVLRVMRRGQISDFRMSDLVENPMLDGRAYPGDRFILINSPRSFSVLGASGRVDQLAFNRSSISLAEAIATAGGANPNYGDAAAIFVFRYVTDESGQTRPVVYHINMLTGGAYLLSQKFAMRDKDVLYFGNAKANQPTKLIQLISQLFSPILTVTSAVQTVQNSRN